MEQIALVASGKITYDNVIKPLILKYDKIIAVDGGVNHCDRMGIVPDLIIGDLDSADPEILEKYRLVPTVKFPRDKDLSDLELAIQHCNSNNITLFGVMEGRADHTLNNLYLLTQYREVTAIESDYETLYCINDYRQFNCKPSQLISLIPLPSPCEGVTSTGLKWELNNQTLNQSFVSLSNLSMGESFSVAVKKGTLICILPRE